MITVRIGFDNNLVFEDFEPGSFVILSARAMRQEVTDWICEYANDNVDIEPWQTINPGHRINHGRIFLFESSEDAMLFKLTFGGE